MSYKTEDGIEFSEAAFAYAPDPSAPDDWKLRLWENTEKKTTRAQLGRAAAALSPGGFRGNRVEIPRDDMAKVKATIRAAYRKLEVNEEEIPVWVKERATPQRIFGAAVHEFEEGAFNEDKGEITLTIIKPGFNADKSRYYPAEVLRSGTKIFEGLKMFADHQTHGERRDRPENSIHNWAGQLKEVWCESDGTIRGKAAVIDSGLREKLSELRRHNLLKEMGASICAVGEGVKAKVEGVGTMLIEKLIKGRSVDFVTYAGAGGAIECLESAHEDAVDIDLITAEDVRSKRPDIYEAIRVELMESTKEGNENMAEIITTIEETTEAAAPVAPTREDTERFTALEAERDQLKAQLEEAQRATARETAKRAIDAALSNAKDLPEPAIAKLRQQFEAAESAEKIEEAITKEREYIAAVAPKAGVQHLGEGASTPESEAGTKELEEVFKDQLIRRGRSVAEAETRARIAARGR